MLRRRQRTLPLFSFFLAFACTVLPAQNPEKLYTATHQQLQAVKVVLAQQAAWNAGDLDKFLSHYKDAPETEVVLGSHVRGFSNVRSAFHINYPTRDAMGTIEYMDVEALELGENFALATGRYRLERSKRGGGGAEGNFTEVMEKTAKGWLVIFSETT